MSAGAFGRAPLGSELDTDLIGEGVLELAEELRAYAARAPHARAGLSDGVISALESETRERAPVVAPVASVTFLPRLTLGLRPASFRSLLAAAALVAALGAGVAFAAGGGLPFNLPGFGPPEQTPPVQTDTQPPVAPGDEDSQHPADDDEDASPEPSDEDDGDEDEDSNKDEDEDDGDEDRDEDSDNGDEDEDSGDEDSDEDEDSGEEDSDEDEDSTEGQDESDDDSDAGGDQAPSDDSDEDDTSSAGNSEVN